MAEALPWQVAELPADAVEIGHIQEPWGLHGWSHVHAISRGGDTLLHARRWFLQPPASRAGARARPFDAFEGTVAVTVAEVRWHGDGVVVRFDGVSDREAAQALRGARIFISRADFPPTTDADEYYWVDLIGLQVVNREGVMLGVVEDLLPTGPHAVLCLRDGSGDAAVERMIPFVAAYVDTVDLAARRITVDWQPDY
jgi:16S rRNA processing protein RimM